MAEDEKDGKRNYFGIEDGWKRPSPARVPKIGQSGSSGSSDLILQELASIKKLIGWGVFVIGLILSIQTILLFLF